MTNPEKFETFEHYIEPATYDDDFWDGWEVDDDAEAYPHTDREGD